jgi:hypothetical protein
LFDTKIKDVISKPPILKLKETLFTKWATLDATNKHPVGTTEKSYRFLSSQVTEFKNAYPGLVEFYLNKDQTAFNLLFVVPYTNYIYASKIDPKIDPTSSGKTLNFTKSTWVPTTPGVVNSSYKQGDVVTGSNDKSYICNNTNGANTKDPTTDTNNNNWVLLNIVPDTTPYIKDENYTTGFPEKSSAAYMNGQNKYLYLLPNSTMGSPSIFEAPPDFADSVKKQLATQLPDSNSTNTNSGFFGGIYNYMFKV